MPEVVMKRILENSDIRSIFTLRKVSRGFRDFIDSTIPDANLEMIQIFIAPDYISVRYDTFNKKIYRITHRITDQNGCVLELGNEKKKSIDKDYVTAFCDDFVNILRHQKSILRYFLLGWKGEQDRYSEELEQTGLQILKDIEERALKIRRAPLKVLSLRINSANKESMMCILPYINSEILETIGLSSPCIFSRKVMDMGEIVDLEQWKKAKALYTPGIFLTANVRDLSHFEKGNFYLKSVTVEDLVYLKEKFLASPSFENIYIGFFSFFPDFEQFLQLFGPPSFEEHFQNTWMIKYPNSKKSLKIVASLRYIHFESAIFF
ncbi:hypothetical protein CAEBREN_32603 [Caenorhabditis brenneri]|uniref:F-box domain-containing protein n=1 Tax=Caenorhabditis brenneri TaxID=135651 RepID=G0NTT0_CAEBE|nr:hypothetical protein CAEBREN_32603 [Caenorhabditis brenneri]